MTTFIYGASSAQFNDYRSHRSGQARNVTWISDSTTLAAVTGSGHVIVYLCGYHSRGDSTVIEAQIQSMVDAGRASVRQEPVGA